MNHEVVACWPLAAQPEVSDSYYRHVPDRNVSSFVFGPRHRAVARVARLESGQSIEAAM